MNIQKVQQQPNQIAFKNLIVDEKGIREAGGKVFAAVRYAMTPEEGELISVPSKIGEHANVQIARSLSPLGNDKLMIRVSNEHSSVGIDDFSTREYPEDGIALGETIKFNLLKLWKQL